MKALPYALALLFATTTYLEYDKEPRVVTNTQIQTIDHVHTVTVTIHEPNGETKTTTTTDDSKEIKSMSVQYAQASKSLTNISLSYGNDFRSTFPTPLYGLHVTRNILGPFTVGAYFLTNHVGGLTVGIDF